jgi:RecA-family ATPase
LDCDGGPYSIEQARDLLADWGVAALLYESPSAATKPNRWRAVMPFSDEMGDRDYRSLVETVASAMPGLDFKPTRGLSTSFLYGGVDDFTPRVLFAEGDCVDRVRLPSTRHEERETDESGSGALYRLARDAVFRMDRDDFREHVADDADASAHVEKQRDGDRAINRAWAKALIHKLAREMRVTGASNGEFLGAIRRHPETLGVLADNEIDRTAYAEWRAAPSHAFDDLGPVEHRKERLPTLEIFWGDEDDGADDLEPLIDGFLYQHSVAALYGQYGEGKSFVALDMALSIATGRPWFGHAVERGPVLYVAPEGYTGLKRRRAAWAKHNALSRAPGDFALVRGSMDLMKPDGVTLESLAREAQQRGAVLIVLDTLNAIFGGADENDSAAMSKARRELERLRDLSGAAVLAIHHAGKDVSRGLRGSSVLGGALDTALLIHESRIISRAPKGKQKDMEAAADIAFSLQSIELAPDRKGNPVSSAVVIAGASECVEDEEKTAMNERERAALEALERLHGVAELCGEKGVSIDAWRNAFCKTPAVSQLNAAAQRQAFKRAKDALEGKRVRLVGENAEPLQ